MISTFRRPLARVQEPAQNPIRRATSGRVKFSTILDVPEGLCIGTVNRLRRKITRTEEGGALILAFLKAASLESPTLRGQR